MGEEELGVRNEELGIEFLFRVRAVPIIGIMARSFAASK